MNIRRTKQIIAFIEELNPIERNFLNSLIFSEVKQPSRQPIERPIIKEIKLHRKRRGHKRAYIPKGRNTSFVARADAMFKTLQEVKTATVKEIKEEMASNGQAVSIAMVDTAMLYLLKIKPSVKMRWEKGKRLFYIQKEGY